eukprot:2616955-Amphidinium_carterae.1
MPFQEKQREEEVKRRFKRASGVRASHGFANTGQVRRKHIGKALILGALPPLAMLICTSGKPTQKRLHARRGQIDPKNLSVLSSCTPLEYGEKLSGRHFDFSQTPVH